MRHIMTIEAIKKQVTTAWSCLTFEYQGKQCGIDPFGPKKFDVWCGENGVTVNSIDEAMVVPIFDGDSLKDIVQKIENIEY